MLKGIDVSQWQGNIDWNNVKVDFAILRLGWIGNKKNHTLDTKFERNYNECKRLGIPVGVYVYCYSNSTKTAKEGANWVTENLKGKTLELPVYIDMEDNSIASLGKDILTQIVYEFNAIIEKAGYWAGVYANKNWFDNYLHKDNIRNRFTTWIAHYGVSEDRYAGQYDILQYTSSGAVNGISGKVDMNVMYRDLLNEINKNVPQRTKTIEEVAQDVLANKYGIYPERKTKLEAEGYNYEEVRKKVNELKKAENKYYPACDKSHKSFVDALNSIGVDSSKENRRKIAIKNGIRNYTFSREQNTQLLRKLKMGKLIKS